MIRPQTCPICEKDLAPNAAVESDLFPFCSKRCRQIDLYRWMEGKYAIFEPLTPEHLEAEPFDESDFDPNGDEGS